MDVWRACVVIESDIQAFGRPLKRQRPTLCPELELWLLDPEIDLEAACQKIEACHPPPYWAFCWGAGQALARYLLDHPETVAGKTVVDWGTGSGIAAIAAARAGAQSVRALDHDPAALRAVERNAQLNDVQLATDESLRVRFEVLIAADVLYEAPLLNWLQQQASNRHRVLIADPLRAASPEIREKPLARYAVYTQPDVDSPSNHAAVFDLSPGPVLAARTTVGGAG
ncbi:50S ribosomal protein L11 methyltransferase [Myxococcota bacterium]|nr:50S ribosomal protein L11 methyltransferase [Myxococcota bacterium]